MSVAINATNFPDPLFRDYVKNNIAGGSDTLTDDMIANVEGIYFLDKATKNLKGIEYFIHLKEFVCGPLAVSSLDLSKNVELERLQFLRGRLFTIDLSKNTKLKIFAAQSIFFGGVWSYVDDDYPFCFNFADHVGSSNIDKVELIDVPSNFEYKYVNGVLKTKESLIYIKYKYDTGNPKFMLDVEITFSPVLLFDHNVMGSSNFVLDNAQKGVPYSNKQISVSSVFGNPSVGDFNSEFPFTVSVVKGVLPPGLSLNITDEYCYDTERILEISGTPT